MENREEILKELQAIAPKLAGMEKTNPYRLPEGYFLNFQTVLMDKIMLGEVKAELNALAPALAKLERRPATDEIPAGYFNQFSSKLIRNIRVKEVQEEVMAVAPELASLEKVNIHQAPEGYFNAFPQLMMQRINAVETQPSNEPSWLDSVNEFLDRIATVVFKPRYALAFSGGATTLFIAALLMMKIQQCSDLDCRFAQLTNDEINNYLENKSDAYSDEVFEGNFDSTPIPAATDQDNMRGYKDALKNVDDAALDAAIAN